MELQLLTIPATRIAYVRQKGPYGPANALAMEQLKHWALESQLLTESASLFGIPQDDPRTTLPEDCRYDACISLPEDAPVTDSAEPLVEYGYLCGGSYAVVTLEHTAEAVQQAWIDLLPALHGSGWQIDTSKPVMERYTGELIRNHLCQLCIPVQL